MGAVECSVASPVNDRAIVTSTGPNHLGKQPKSFPDGAIPKKYTLVECAGDCFHFCQLQRGSVYGLFRGKWSVIGVSRVPRMPCSRNGGGSRNDHRDGNSQVGFERSVLV